MTIREKKKGRFFVRCRVGARDCLGRATNEAERGGVSGRAAAAMEWMRSRANAMQAMGRAAGTTRSRNVAASDHTDLVWPHTHQGPSKLRGGVDAVARTTAILAIGHASVVYFVRLRPSFVFCAPLPLDNTMTPTPRASVRLVIGGLSPAWAPWSDSTYLAI